MADVERPGRVDRDEFDVHLSGILADVRIAVRRPALEHAGESGAPETVIEAEVDETGARDLGRDHPGTIAKALGQLFAQFTRVHLGALGQHQGGVGRDIAMGGIARRLGRDAPGLEPRRQRAFRHKAFYRRHNFPLEVFEKVHSFLA